MSVRFDSAADRLLRTTDLLSYANPYTWMGWVYLVSDLNNYQTFLTINNNGITGEDYFGTGVDGVTLVAYVYSNGAPTEVAGSVLTVGVWYHIAVVRESTTSAKVYLNGVLDVTNTRDIAAGSGRAANTRVEVGGEFSTNGSRLNGR